LYLGFLECILSNTALRAYPIIGYVLKRRASGDSPIRIAHLGVVDIAAYGADPSAHRLPSHSILQNRLEYLGYIPITRNDANCQHVPATRLNLFVSCTLARAAEELAAGSCPQLPSVAATPVYRPDVFSDQPIPRREMPETVA
jgi:hypothetical protein